MRLFFVIILGLGMGWAMIPPTPSKVSFRMPASEIKPVNKMTTKIGKKQRATLTHLNGNYIRVNSGRHITRIAPMELTEPKKPDFYVYLDRNKFPTYLDPGSIGFVNRFERFDTVVKIDPTLNGMVLRVFKPITSQFSGTLETQSGVPNRNLFLNLSVNF